MKKKNKRKAIIKATGVYYVAMIMVYLYLFGACIYKYINSHKISNCMLEIVFILVLSGIIAFSNITPSTKKKRKRKMKLRFNLSKKKKQFRIKSYLSESILISLGITTIIFTLFSYDVIFINFYSIIPSNAILAIFLILILVFVSSFIIMFLGNYVLSEFLVRKYQSLSK